MSLVEVNARAHVELEARWLDVMEALLTLRLDDARVALLRFEAVILRHAAFEDAEVLPRFVPEEGDRTSEHVSGDHKILERVIAGALRQLDALRAASPPPPLREVASVLEPFVRVHNVLTHHTDREQSRLYPALDDTLPAAERETLEAALTASVFAPPVGA